MKLEPPQPNKQYTHEESSIFHICNYPLYPHDVSMSAQILILEVDESLRRSLAIALRFEGYHIVAVGNSTMAWQMLAEHKIDLVLLDVDRPLPDGHTFCVELRKRSNVPIIVVSAKTNADDLVTCIQLGADAYMSKPFPIQVLNARIRAMLRRMRHLTEKHVNHVLIFGDIVLDEKKHEVTVRGEPVELSPSEYSLLSHLMRNPGKLIRKEEIQEVLWNYQPMDDTSSVRVNIRRLRRKIELDPANPYYLKTIYGQGYQFVQVE